MFNGSGSSLDFSEVLGNVLVIKMCRIVDFWNADKGVFGPVLMKTAAKSSKFIITNCDLNSGTASMPKLAVAYSNCSQNVISKYSASKIMSKSADETAESQNSTTETSGYVTKLSTSEAVSNLNQNSSREVNLAPMPHTSKVSKTSNLVRNCSNSILCSFPSYMNNSSNGRSSHVRSSLVLNARFSYTFPLFFSTDYFKSLLSQYNFKCRLFIFSFKLNSITSSDVGDALLNLVLSVPVISYRHPMIVVFLAVISMPFYRFNYPVSCYYYINLELLFLLNNDDVIRLVFFKRSVI